MRRLLLILSVYVLSANCYGEGIILDARFDHTGSSVNDAGQTAGLRDNSSFSANRLRFLFSNKLRENITAKVRLNALSASTAPVAESGVSKYIDFAFITHNLNENAYLSFGKIVALIGGREAMVNPGDYYFTSTAGAELLAKPTTGIWPMGAIFGYQVSDQKAELLVANTTSSETTTVGGNTRASQSRSMVGISYLGSFGEKKIQPILSYHQDSDSANTDSRTYAAAGCKFSFDPIDIEVDYLMNTADYKAWVVGNIEKTTSLVGSVRYKFSEHFHALAKVESSVSEIATAAGADPVSKDTDYMVYGLAAEYIPYADLKMRYHLAYTSTAKEPDGSDNQTETKIIAGLRLNHDLLK